MPEIEETLDIDFKIIEDHMDKKQAESVILESGKDDEKRDEKQKQRIDFLNSDFTSSLFQKETNERNVNESPVEDETAYDEKKGTFTDNPPVDDANYPNAADLQDITGFLMEAFDTGVSYLCCAISGTTNPEKFEVERRKKEKLSNQLAVILAKHKFQMSLEWMFVISLCLVYMAPLQRAWKIREDKKGKVVDDTVFEPEPANRNDSTESEKHPFRSGKRKRQA